MANTCKSMADSFQCMTKPTTIKKKTKNKVRLMIGQKHLIQNKKGFPGPSDGKESTCTAGDLGSIPGLQRSPGEYPVQYSCLGNPTDRKAWQAAVHVVAKSRTRLSD